MKKIKDTPKVIKVCYQAYKPAIREEDIDELVDFIVIVVQEGFKTVKVA